GVPAEELPEIVAKKLAWLDIGLLRVRTAVVLVLFVGIAWAAGAWSRRPPSTGLAAGALMVFGIGVTVFTVDWLMAFEPKFYSTIYAAMHGSGAVVAALGLGTLWLWMAEGDAQRLGDCGMLMLGWAMVWLYMAFMQYLVIWSGDLPVEIGWYLARIGEGWRVVLWVAVAAHVGAIAAMSSPTLKQRPAVVAATAGALLVGQAADFWWRTAPAFEREGWLAGALDVAAVATLGGLWLAAAIVSGSAGERREARHG
ncbi:MAG TPA: hypothetical protein VFJ13_09485, partial [Paracoccaceae bacterium]|nr:hypothetical protein [Paracoccaceae bacterium]